MYSPIKKSSKRAVIIPDADLGENITLSVIRCLGKRSNYHTVLLSSSNSFIKFSKYADVFIHKPNNFDQNFLDIISSKFYSNKKPIVLPITLDGFKFVSKNKEAFTKFCIVPPISSIETIIKASDKWHLFEIAKNNGIPVLPSYPLTKDTINFIKKTNTTYPYLVKSRSRRGGFGFSAIHNEKELSDICSNLVEEDKDEYIIQPLIDAIDYSLSVYCENGEIKAFTLWKAILYGGRKYSIPRAVEFTTHNKVVEAGRSLLKAINWDGVADVDFIVDKNTGSISLLEINARFWQTVPACLEAGVNFPALMCDAALDNISCFPRQKAGVIYARPSALFDLFSKKWAYNRRSSIINAAKIFFRILNDPLPEVCNIKKIF